MLYRVSGTFPSILSLVEKKIFQTKHRTKQKLNTKIIFEKYNKALQEIDGGQSNIAAARGVIQSIDVIQ